MITELEKGMLLGYLINAPEEVKHIANKLVDSKTQLSMNLPAAEQFVIDLNQDLLEFSETLDLLSNGGEHGAGMRVINVLKSIYIAGFINTTGKPIKTVGQFLAVDWKVWLKQPHLGRKSINILKSRLKEQYNIIPLGDK